MDIRKIKEVNKIYNNLIGDMIKIKALIFILSERNCEKYPVNILFEISSELENFIVKDIIKCTDILYEILQSKKVKF